MTPEEIFELVLKDEGKLSDHPDDNGGLTHYGILYDEWVAHVHPRKTSRKEFQTTFTPELAKEIYKLKYWTPLRCAELPPGVAYIVFDAGLLHGIFNSARWLQLAVNVKVDSNVGPKTVAATLSADDAETITAIHNWRMKRIKAHTDYKVFGRGWTNRLLRVKKKALSNAR